MFQHKNAYPVVLVPGLTGYGEGSKMDKILPHFGMTATSAKKVINDMGLPCYTASFNSVSGVWDRACELYAQIVGGTVDYGVVHSQKYGHKRFGKTYLTPMVPNWGELSADGKLVKLTLIASGFGAPVARLFAYLMAYGSPEESAATAKDQLSGLFYGGYGELIHCVTTLSGINGGITTFQALEDKMPGAQKKIIKAFIAAEEMKNRKEFLDLAYAQKTLKVTQYDLSMSIENVSEKDPYGSITFDEVAIDKYMSMTEGNIFYEMSIPGMAEFNNRIAPLPDTFYLSFTGSVTKKLFNRFTLPFNGAGVLAPISAFISTYENYYEDKPYVTPVYHENDGLINTESSLAPISEPAVGFSSVEKCNPGLWYQMPVENRNHLSFLGFLERPDHYRNYIYDLIKTISSLE